MAVKIDLKDKKILYELDRNSRQTNKQIAKRVRLSEQVTGNRIRRFLDEGIIENFFVKTNPAVLGFMHIKIYIRLHNINNKKEEELLLELNKSKGIYWLCSLRGKYDLVASIYVKNISDFSLQYEKLFGKWGDYILERNVIVLERGFTYTKAFLLPKTESEEIIYSEDETLIDIDEIDINLLKILNNRARESLIDISNELNVSADTVRYRLKNLRKNGIITGFGAKIDFNKLNNSYFIISLKLQNMNQQKHNKLQSLVKLNKNIIIFVKTIGDHDVELEVEM